MATTVGESPELVEELPVWALGGGYIVERVLGGDGSLVTVVRARGVVSGRPVVVKLLAGHLAADPLVRDRFLRAAELGCRLSHPNVVRVLHAGIDGQPFLVMEYMEGEPLADHLARGGRFSAAETLTLATHLAAGLAHAHASGVVHGALDPASVLLGRDGVARLTDFGLARALAEAGPAAAAAGDPPHRADEQPVGRHPDPAADVYGLGMVLRQAGGDGLPLGLAAIVDAALAPDRSLRPSAVDVFHEVLALTSPPGVWLAPAVASTWNAVTV